jgi:hypothetical protein
MYKSLNKDERNRKIKDCEIMNNTRIKYSTTDRRVSIRIRGSVPHFETLFTIW